MPASSGGGALSVWLGAGADPKVVQRVLGHATAAMTMDLYGHLVDANLWQAADNLRLEKPTHGRTDGVIQPCCVLRVSGDQVTVRSVTNGFCVAAATAPFRSIWPRPRAAERLTAGAPAPGLRRGWCGRLPDREERRVAAQEEPRRLLWR